MDSGVDGQQGVVADSPDQERDRRPDTIQNVPTQTTAAVLVRHGGLELMEVR
jgi:hypothetical protein